MAVALAGCTTQEPGTPSAGAESTGTTTSTPGTTSPAPAADPCEWLPSSMIKELGISTSARPKKSKGYTACRWRAEKPVIADSFSLDITYYQQDGIKDLQGSQPRTPVKVGSRDAVQTLDETANGCVVAINVTDSSRVDVYVLGGPAPERCKIANAVAGRIEPELP
nr:DUF3558 domain-containing protein [Actinokineospora cianjurensis]